MRFIIVPGWRDSGPGHWQSLWADRLAGAVRVQQDDWITPSRQAWVAIPEDIPGFWQGRDGEQVR